MSAKDCERGHCPPPPVVRAASTWTRPSSESEPREPRRNGMPRRRETPPLSGNHQDVRLVVPRTADAAAEVLQVEVEVVQTRCCDVSAAAAAATTAIGRCCRDALLRRSAVEGWTANGGATAAAHCGCCDRRLPEVSPPHGARPAQEVSPPHGTGPAQGEVHDGLMAQHVPRIGTADNLSYGLQPPYGQA